MKIRFTQEVVLPCVKVWPVEYDGEAAELDMECQVRFRAGEEFDGVKIDEETPETVRVWLREDFVALRVPRECFESVP